MIVVLEDDDCLYVYESIADVVWHIDSLDAEDVMRAVFDQDGQRHRKNGFEIPLLLRVVE